MYNKIKKAFVASVICVLFLVTTSIVSHDLYKKITSGTDIARQLAFLAVFVSSVYLAVIYSYVLPNDKLFA